MRLWVLGAGLGCDFGFGGFGFWFGFGFGFCLRSGYGAIAVSACW